MRRKLSLTFLFAAWLCANGVVWNVVQVIAWAKMYHQYSQVMPATQALKVTFSGEAPCDLCNLAQAAEDTARQQLPHDVLGAGHDKFVLVCTLPAPVILLSPDSAWPSVAHDIGLTRTNSVPVPPPRA